MASENLKIDESGRWTLGAVTNNVAQELKRVRVNPITGALIVEASITSTNTSIGSTIPGGTEGSVLFLGPGSTLAQDNANFFYNDASNFLGLGTNTPAATLHVAGTVRFVLGADSTGDIYYRTAGGNLARLGIGASNQILTVSAGIPAWADASGFLGYTTVAQDGVAVTQRDILNFINFFIVTDNAPNTDVNLDTAAIANDTTFITTLTSNTTFISDIVNIVNNNTSISIDLTTQVTGILPVANGGTGANTLSGVLVGNGTSAITGTAFTQGDIFYGSAANTMAILNKDTNATRYLSNTGTTNNPAWAQVNLANGVTGLLPLANGGTGSNLTDPAANKLWGWDDTDNSIGFWTIGSGLSYDHSTHTISSTGSGGDITVDLTAGQDLTIGDTVGYATFIDDEAFKAAWVTNVASFTAPPQTDPDQGIIATCRLTDDTYILLFQAFFNTGSGRWGAVSATLDRDTLTWSFGDVINLFSAPLDGVAIVALDTDKFAIAHFTQAINPYIIRVDICTLSGSTITLHGNDTFSEPSTDNGSNVGLVRLATDRFAMVIGHNNTGGHCDLFEVTVDGSNVPTIGTQEVLDSSTTNISFIALIGTDKVAVVNAGTIWVATVSAGTWTVGSGATVLGATGTNPEKGGMLSLATDTVYVNSGNNVQYLTISGTTPSLVANITLPSSGLANSGLATDQTDVYLIAQTTNVTFNGVTKIAVDGSDIVLSTPVPLDLGTETANFTFQATILEGSDYYGVVQNGGLNQLTEIIHYIFHIQGMTPYFVGIAQSSTNRGDVVPVKISGVDTNQSGLFAGSLYVPFEGGLVGTIDPSDPFVMVAQNSTSIKI